MIGISSAPARQLPGAGDPWRMLVDAASEPYRAAGRFAWHFARGKLKRDPVFRYLLREGLIAPHSRVLDIGCGQGLLASLLREAGTPSQSGAWPAGWAAPPEGARVTGIELMPRDVERAQRALGSALEIVCGDMRRTPFPPCDAVVVLDVLHYVPIDEQDKVLERIRSALVPGGRLLLRVGDAGARRGFAISQWVDRLVTTVRGHRTVPVYGRTLAQWTARLHALGFRVRAQPMSQGTPFANVLLVASRPADARGAVLRPGIDVA